MPVSVMKAVITRNEFDKWMIYLQNKQPEIQEIQLAVLSTLVANGLGSKSKVHDFLISKPEKNTADTPTAGMDAASVRSAFSGIAVPMK